MICTSQCVGFRGASNSAGHRWSFVGVRAYCSAQSTHFIFLHNTREIPIGYQALKGHIESKSVTSSIVHSCHGPNRGYDYPEYRYSRTKSNYSCHHLLVNMSWATSSQNWLISINGHHQNNPDGFKAASHAKGIWEHDDGIIKS
jgi:hypothetical protein